MVHAELSTSTKKLKLWVSASVAMILLVALLFWTIRYPLTWLAVVSGMFTYVILDTLENKLKSAVGKAIHLWFAPFYLFAGIFILICVGVALGALTLAGIVNFVLSPQFGGSQAVAFLTAIAPVILVTYLTTQSEYYRKLKTPMEIIIVQPLGRVQRRSTRHRKKNRRSARKTGHNQSRSLVQ